MIDRPAPSKTTLLPGGQSPTVPLLTSQIFSGSRIDVSSLVLLSPLSRFTTTVFGRTFLVSCLRLVLTSALLANSWLSRSNTSLIAGRSRKTFPNSGSACSIAKKSAAGRVTAIKSVEASTVSHGIPRSNPAQPRISPGPANCRLV